VKNCLKKKSDEKEKVNRTYENQEQMFITTLNANDHTAYDGSSILAQRNT
jgi:hypothetical protein